MSTPTGLPSGVVTFLFTDVVGSTRTWEAEPEAMSTALKMLDAIMTETVAEHDGVLIKIRGEGDSTFSVFQYASDALHAAVAAQRRIAAERWPTERPITMRVAIHSGEAEERSGDYYGRTVNRAARVRSLAGAGEVLISHATRQLVAERAPAGVDITSLGLLQLKDIRAPEEIFAVRFDGQHVTRPDEDVAPAPTTVRLQSTVVRASERRLVGREHERTLLGKLIRTASDRGRPVVLVQGEAGLGKSALCCRVAAEAHDDGMTVLFGRCEPDLPTPFRPFVEALGHFIRECDDDALTAIGPEALRELSRIVPDVAARRPSVTMAVRAETDVDRFILMNAIVKTLSVAAANAAVVLVVDDAHWADQASLQMLRHLVQTADDIRLAVLVTYRNTDLDDAHPMRALLGDLHREPTVVEVELAGLSTSEIIELLRARFMSEESAGTGGELHALAEEVRTNTNGNPFFAGEIIRQLSDTHASGFQGGAIGLRDLPDSVAHVVEQRVSRHGETARQLLTIAAVCGSTFDAGMVARLAELSEDQTLDLLEEMQHAHLVVETSTVERFQFAHGLVRQVLYDGLSNTRRARLHRRVATQLEAEVGPNHAASAAELARHWERGGAIGDRPKVVHYTLMAADRAMAQRAPQAALDHYSSALELLDQSDSTTRCDVLTGIGEARRQLGLPDSIDALIAAADLADELGDTERLTRAVLAINRGMVTSAGEVDAVKMDVIDRALDAVGTADSESRARLLALQGAELLYNGDFETRRAISDEALAIARRLGNPATLVHVLNERFLTIAAPSTARERLAHAVEAESIAEQIDDPVAEFFAALGGSLASLECGDGADYCRRLDTMGVIADDLRQPMLRWIFLWNDAVRVMNLGHLDQADEVARNSLQLGLSLEQRDAFINYAGVAGSILMHRGRLATMVDALESAVRDYPAISSYRVIHAGAMAAAGAVEQPLAVLEDVLASEFGDFGDDLFAGIALSFCAELAIHFGHDRAAEALIPKLAPHRDLVVCGPTNCRGSYAHWIAGLYGVLDEADEADRWYATAEEINDRLGFPYFSAMTKLARGSALGDGAMIAEASAIATAHGFVGLSEQCAAVLS